ncbi:MAG TPA: M15 family metallopeptidase [Thermoleophilaceae bacterium]|jgi:D-alanyl-D-alanine dipeptidase
MRAREALLGLGAAALLAGAVPAQAAPGTLTVRQMLRGGLYIEGSYSYMRLRNARGRVVVEREFRGAPVRLRRRLPPGRYRLRSWQRPCDGNCSLLDPPTDVCSRRLRVLSGGRTVVKITVRPGRGCRMAIRAQPALFPPRARIRAARRFLAHRGALNGFALIDTRGQIHGFAPHRVYVSASVVKAMLLVAYLRRIGNRMPNAAERAALGPMIQVSDNGRATAVYRRVGDAALRALAARAHMRTFSIFGFWGSAFFSAEDQARFFFVFDRLVPPRSRAYARRLLSSIVSWQRWGFSRYARAAGFRTFFKGGWRGTDRGRLVHEAAMFERRGLRFSMAVLTDGDPSHEYGTATLRGVAARIFGRPRRGTASGVGGSPATRRAGLVDVRRYGPGIGVDMRYATRRNLTGRRLPGYCRRWPLLMRAPARALARVQRRLRRRGLGLLVLDAYRPVRATNALVRWAERTGRGDLVGTYIARRSRHNLGSAVDLTLVRGGTPVRMGGAYDDLGPGAHTLNARGRSLRNRLTLKRAMERFGFAAYDREWWHFEHRILGTRYLDVPLGCRR